MVGAFINGQVNAGGFAILTRKALLHGDSLFTHVVTQHGRDHIVKIHSGDKSVMIASYHMELGSSLRNIRERLQLVATHWPTYPDGLGIIMISTSANLRKEEVM